MISTVSGFESSGQCINDCSLVIGLNRSIASENPNDCFVFVSATKKLTIPSCSVWVKDRFAGCPVTAPRGKKPDKHPQFFCFVNNEIDVLEICFVRFSGIAIYKRKVAVGIG